MTTFASPEVRLYWDYIAKPVERILAAQQDLTVEELNWQPPAPDTNSLQVLAVHITGNLAETVLELLFGIPAHREREAEFRAVADGTDTVPPHWPELRDKLESSLATLEPAALDRSFDHPRRGAMSGREVLLSVSTHAHEHAGHAELTRQLILANRDSA
jgi:hypothetical protein